MVVTSVVEFVTWWRFHVFYVFVWFDLLYIFAYVVGCGLYSIVIHGGLAVLNLGYVNVIFFVTNVRLGL
jgi:hypothetical protein